MTHIGLLLGMYGSNAAIITQLYTQFGYRTYGTIDYHALSMKKAGYGEPKQVVDINESILAHQHTRWYDLRNVDQLRAWEDDAEIRHQQDAYIATLSGNALINDPRMCYTVPSWMHAFHDAGHDVTIIIPVQSPLAYAHAMHTQHQMSTRLALALWVAYTLAIESLSRTYTRIVMRHDALLTNWQLTCQPIINHLAPHGLPTEVITQLDAYMHMVRATAPNVPQPSPQIQALSITQLALDVYNAVCQAHIDEAMMTEFKQRLQTVIDDPQCQYDVAQFDMLYHDIFLDSEARVRALHERHSDEMRRQHSEFSTKIHLLHEEHSKKMTELYEQHGKYIQQQSALFAETLTKHQHQLADMQATFAQEIDHLNTKIASMQSEIDWRIDVTTQQQGLLDKLGWAIRILTLKERIQGLWRK